MRDRCPMGVGCDEVGICYAEAHGEPERCPVAVPTLPPLIETHIGFEYLLMRAMTESFGTSYEALALDAERYRKD